MWNRKHFSQYAITLHGGANINTSVYQCPIVSHVIIIIITIVIVVIIVIIKAVIHVIIILLLSLLWLLLLLLFSLLLLFLHYHFHYQNVYLYLCDNFIVIRTNAFLIIILKSCVPCSIWSQCDPPTIYSCCKSSFTQNTNPLTPVTSRFIHVSNLIVRTQFCDRLFTTEILIMITQYIKTLKVHLKTLTEPQ